MEELKAAIVLIIAIALLYGSTRKTRNNHNTQK